MAADGFCRRRSGADSLAGTDEVRDRCQEVAASALSRTLVRASGAGFGRHQPSYVRHRSGPAKSGFGLVCKLPL